MVQWYKTGWEVGIFLKEPEIKILLKEMLIAEKTWNKCRMICMGGHEGHAFCPTCSVLNLFSGNKFTNTVPVSRCLKRRVQIISRCPGYIYHFQRDR